MKKLIGDRSFYRRLFAVMTPILIQNIITNFVSLLDNIMVDQVGTEPMSGVAIVNQLLFVFNLCIFGGLSGAGIFTAQFYGKRDNAGIRDTFRIKLYFSAASIAVFCLLFLTKGETLISLFLHEGQEDLDLAASLRYALNYLHVMLLQTLPFALMQAYASTLRETGETMLPMKAGVSAVFVNIFFNYILIFGKLGFPAMGVVGAAAATVIARLTECAIVMIWTHRHRAEHPYITDVYRSAGVPWPLARQVTVTSFPLLANEVLWAAGLAALNQCYSTRGLEVVSAFNISSTVSNLFFCAYLAMGTAVSIIIGQLLGEGRLEQAVDADTKLIAFSVVLSVVVGAVMAALAPLFPQIYNTTDTVKALAVQLLIVAAAMMPLHSFANVCYFTLRSGGKTTITFLFDSGLLWVSNIPLAFILSRFTALPVVLMYFIVECLTMIKVILGFFLVRSRKWVNNLVDGQ